MVDVEKAPVPASRHRAPVPVPLQHLPPQGKGDGAPEPGAMPLVFIGRRLVILHIEHLGVAEGFRQGARGDEAGPRIAFHPRGSGARLGVDGDPVRCTVACASIPPAATGGMCACLFSHLAHRAVTR